jgi:hypothetical protein
VSLVDLLKLQVESGGDLLARAEDSGCESTYWEVARWNEARRRWERFAFEKCLDVFRSDVPGLSADAGDQETAEAVAKIINDAAWHKGRMTWVHTLPTYEQADAETVQQEKANGHMSATANDLLAALEDAEFILSKIPDRDVTTWDRGAGLHARMRAAIAKAKGGAA